MPKRTLVVRPVNLNLEVVAYGEGTTEPALGIHTYFKGELVTIAASPASGWRFTHWGGDASGEPQSTVITIDGDKSVTACFEKIPVLAPLYIANRNSMEIHKSDCFWVTQMKDVNKVPCSSLVEVTELIRDKGYNGCFYCLTRYDRDALAEKEVLINLEEDLGH